MVVKTAFKSVAQLKKYEHTYRRGSNFDLYKQVNIKVSYYFCGIIIFRVIN